MIAGSDDFKVPYTEIREIIPHNNAHSLEIAKVFDFNVIVPKDKYKVGDKIVYVPIDSILNNYDLEKKLFPEGSKIVLHHHRVRQIKIRGLASQGMIIDADDVIEFLDLDKVKNLDSYDNLAADLNITKYEPPVVGPSTTLKKGDYRKRSDHPNFHQYNGVQNVKWFPDLFTNGAEVVIQEKLHGTNARASLLSFVADTWYKKLISFLGLAPKVYKAYGSNRVEISKNGNYKGYYNEDLYGTTFKKVDVFNKLKLGETVFGEIIGPKIQANYEYGLKELTFVLFDVKVLLEDGKQKWLNPEEVEAFAKERGFDMVPILYAGPYSKEIAYNLSKGPSIYSSKQKVREGCVIKSRYDYSKEGNKQAYKWINEDYLNDKTNTDNH